MKQITLIIMLHLYIMLKKTMYLNFSASDDTNDYYYKNEKYAKSDDELTQLIKDASNDDKEITNIKVDYSLGYTEDQLYSKIGELVKSGEADIRSAGYFNNTLALLK